MRIQRIKKSDGSKEGITSPENKFIELNETMKESIKNYSSVNTEALEKMKEKLNIMSEKLEAGEGIK